MVWVQDISDRSTCCALHITRSPDDGPACLSCLSVPRTRTWTLVSSSSAQPTAADPPTSTQHQARQHPHLHWLCAELERPLDTNANTMAAYIASPTLSSPSQYAPTFHGHGQSISYRQGYTHFHHHQRNGPSFSLAASTSTGSDVAGGGGASFAPLRSALARRAQASECVQPPTRAGTDGEPYYTCATV